MGLLAKIFTWWDGATIGTSLYTFRRGRRVGDDAHGNVYYEGSVNPQGLNRRWVIYKGANDASRVLPEWHGWLHHMIDDLPDRALPPARSWERPAVGNATGSATAHYPAGALEAGGKRAPATGDYEAWVP
jgi:NADH:ubiquinone oxidoreductase subunit